MSMVIARGYDLRVSGEIRFYNLFPKNVEFKVSVSETFWVYANKTTKPFKVWYPAMKQALDHFGAVEIIFSAKRGRFTKENIDRVLTALQAFVNLRAHNSQNQLPNNLQQVAKLQQEIEPQLNATQEALAAAQQDTGIGCRISYKTREWGYA